MQGLFGRNLNRICRKIFSEGPAQVMQGHTEDFRPRSSHKGLYKIMQGSMPLSSCRLVKTSPSSIAAVDLKHHFCPRPLEGHEKPTTSTGSKTSWGWPKWAHRGCKRSSKGSTPQSGCTVQAATKIIKLMKKKWWQKRRPNSARIRMINLITIKWKIHSFAPPNLWPKESYNQCGGM